MCVCLCVPRAPSVKPEHACEWACDVRVLSASSACAHSAHLLSGRASYGVRVRAGLRLRRLSKGGRVVTMRGVDGSDGSG